jgi:uncharacterized protein (UPF0332 family)
VTGDAFLALAGRTLAARSPDEATCRSAISRAYYGVFHLASEFLNELSFRVGARHDAVWKHLEVSGNATAALVGQKLNSLYQERRRADYDLRVVRWGELTHAKRCVEEANEIQILLLECATSKDAICAGINQFLSRHGGRMP